MVKFAPSSIDKDGMGLLAVQVIPAGTEIGVSHEVDPKLVGVSVGGWKMNHPIGNYNHSDTPNCHLDERDGHKVLIADKDLEPGEELTADYRLTKDLEQPGDYDVFESRKRTFKQFFSSRYCTDPIQRKENGCWA